ncbi:TPA: DUF2498 family protein [Klebsiella pneumoniae]|uniref:DUF2498 family protein n=1 Tax=Klebsiella pneumoniae TaxID=573 RepID=UPI0019165CE9|nr:DUF2498 family protein [Klebsiella pneumoniae]MCX9972592.1 DUF2498 family protein [Klebsiella pneumoniae]MCZ6934816.1 DUF2498 family protein [Klebsiella pneumoniae]HBT5133089.1 DUF2498 family protein [Klebsiella pneumoniae]
MEKEISSIIEIANYELKSMSGFSTGMEITAVTKENGATVFRGNMFTDAYGLPTDNTKIALSLYEQLSKKFSNL